LPHRPAGNAASALSLKQASYERYGKPREDVEAAIRKKYERPPAPEKTA
jgi:hypothetical protein